MKMNAERTKVQLHVAVISFISAICDEESLRIGQLRIFACLVPISSRMTPQRWKCHQKKTCHKQISCRSEVNVRRMDGNDWVQHKRAENTRETACGDGR